MIKNLLLLLVFFSLTVQAQNYKFGKISEEELQQKEHPKYKDADAAVLYRSAHTEFQYDEGRGFYLVTEYQERIKIYNEAGYEYATKLISLFGTNNRNEESVSGIKGSTYYLTPNGKIEETKLRNDGIFDEKQSKTRTLTKFTMPALRPGAVIEFKYKVDSPFIANIDTYVFQETIPVDMVELRFEAPEYFIFQSHRRGWHPYEIDVDKYPRTMNYRRTYTALELGAATGETMTKQVKFFQNVYTVQTKDVPPIKKEAYAGNIDNYKASLKFELQYTNFPNSSLENYTSNWEAVANSIYKSDGFGDQLDRSRYFEQDLDPILANAKDNNDKMLLIYEFVKSRMNSNGYIGFYADEGVRDAYKSGIGNTADINLMLTAMFRYAGLDANPVLISTKSHGIPIFPTRNGFNYVISAVAMGDQYFVFDASNKYGSPNVLGEHLLNWQGRLVKEDGTSTWIGLHSAEHSVHSVMINAAFNDGYSSIKGEARTQYTNNRALKMRQTIDGLTNSDTETKVGTMFHDVSVKNINVDQIDNPYNPLKIDFDFEATKCSEEINGNIYVSPLAFLSMNENPFKLDNRTYPIDYGFITKDRYIINLDIPEGYKVESLPQGVNVKVGDNLMTYKCLISESNNKIQLMIDFAINEYFISAENYPEIKQFYDFILENQGEQVVLSKV